ncbi:MAG: hypothetical protein Q4G69_07985 [Planctomycetia bacterium]|nr:hypothetical protein [Planctomycetia bacterium]
MKIKTGLLAVVFGLTAVFAANGWTAGAPEPAQGQKSQAPTMGNSGRQSGPAGVSNDLVKNQDLLLKARRSLMRRDVASAERYLKEAQSIKVSYRDVDDRPDYILPLIEQYKSIEQAARAKGFTETIKRDLARNYLQQAEALRRCRDFDNAEALIMEARNLNVVLDAQTVQSGMDIAAVLQRVRDDRTALQTIQQNRLPEAAPLTQLSEATRKQVAEIQKQLVVARQLINAGQYERAEELGRQLQKIGVPENAFVGGDSPNRLLGDIAIRRSGQFNQVSVPQNGVIRPVQAVQLQATGQSNGYLYVKEAEAALRAGKNDLALKNFRDALRYSAEMDAQTIKHINDSIARLNNLVNAMSSKPVEKTSVNFNQAPQAVQTEISAYIMKSRQLREEKPKEALEMLTKLKEELNRSKLDASMKGHFSYSIDMAINDTNRFIEENGPMIALDNKNKDVEQKLRAEREQNLQIQNQLAQDTEKFNQLLEEGKYDEAIILAKKCQDYSDNSVVSIQMFQMARTKKQVAFNEKLKTDREAGWLQGMNDVEKASVLNVSDDHPLDYGPLWERVKNRTAIDTGGNRSEADQEILNKLDMRITLPFDQPVPLATVMEFIRTSIDINLLIDNQALAEAGINSDMVVETKLANITLKNYLKHILEPYNLTYVVDDEVLKITSKNKRSGKVRTVIYNVTDLVIGIPNSNGLNSALTMESQFNRAFNNVAGRGGVGKSSANTIAGLNTNQGSNTMLSPDILAQIASAGGKDANLFSGDGAAGGMAEAEALKELIMAVVDPDSWADYGDPQFFQLTQSLAIRQTEENHQEIKDLLDKLRSLLDLQIAVEVRYITISDEYAERIGVNFNANFTTDAPSQEDSDGYLMPAGEGVYGLASSDASGGRPFTESMNVEFSQNSYGFAVPQFGNFDPSVGAQMGFAILSDIESYFFISAAESDRRSNILQAPKVTLFNGQTANVYDMMQVPFVMTVIPVVGEFAVAQQPVVTVINEGQFMTVQAVASHDRRFVRMTVVPFFSTITDKDRTFKFEGTDSTVTNSTSASKGSSETTNITDEREASASTEYVKSGTTVQQPIISMFSVFTTVKVPDGGTVVLGGIKRLSEGRNEGGVPILSKIPYLKRLFTNSAIGRETTSMIMMVTPRIIIQEEEEEYVMGPSNSI